MGKDISHANVNFLNMKATIIIVVDKLDFRVKISPRTKRLISQ